MTDRDPEFDAIKPQEIFTEARDRLRIAEAAESENRKRAKEALLFVEGEQWPPDRGRVLEEESPRVVINLTEALVRRVVNNIKQQRPRGRTHPVGDGADVQLSETMNGLGRHVEARSTTVPYDKGAESSVKIGWGYWRLLIEFVGAKSFMQDVKLVAIDNVFTVYMDPSATDPTACDAMWCLISVKMKRTEYKRRYPKAEPAAWASGQDIDREGWESEEEIRLAEYFRVREIPETLLEVTRADGATASIYESELEEGRDSLPEGHKVTRERETTRRQVEWFQLNGAAVIKREILPGQWIPVIRAEGNATNIDGKVYRKGMVQNCIDPGRMVNYGESATLQRLGLAPKSPWIAAEGQLVGHPEWETSNREPHAVLTYTPTTVATAQGDVLVPPPQRNPPPAIEAGFSELVQRMRTNLMAVAGMPSEPGADTESTVVSGRAIQRRDKLSDQSHFQYYDNLTLSIQHTWRIMLEYIRACYSEAEARRAIGEDGQPKMVQVNQPRTDEDGIERILNDLSVGEFDITMDTGPGYETRREEGAESILQLMQSPPLAQLIAQHGADLLIRAIDHPYMQELADRLQVLTPQGLQSVMEQLPARAQNLIKAMVQQNQTLQQQNQQLTLENKYHLAGKKIETESRERIASMNDDTKRLDTRVRSTTALGVEEVRGGTNIMRTHVEAIHNAVAEESEARRMIEAGEHARE